MTISKSEFLGLVKAESAARKSTAVLSRSRRSAIAERTGLSKSRVFACLTPNSTNQLTKREYAQIKAVLQDIENEELEWGVEA